MWNLTSPAAPGSSEQDPARPFVEINLQVGRAPRLSGIPKVEPLSLDANTPTLGL